MDKVFIQEQKTKTIRNLEPLEQDKGHIKQALVIVSEYLSSLLNPEEFTEDQREDLRKLALELGYTEDTKFDVWFSKLN